MGKMESAIRDEVSRLARREVRKAVGPLLKERARLEGQIAALKKDLQTLQKQVAPERRQPQRDCCTAEAGQARGSGPAETEGRGVGLTSCPVSCRSA